MKSSVSSLLIILGLLGYSIYETILNSNLRRTNNKFHILFENRNTEDSINWEGIRSQLIINYDYTNFNSFANKLISDNDIEGKLVLFFRYENCGACVIKVLSELDTIISSGIIDYNDVVLIGQNTGDSPFTYRVMEKYHKQFQTIWISTEDYFKPLANWPYFFIAVRDKSNNTLFVPDLIPDFTETYFKDVVAKAMITD